MVTPDGIGPGIVVIEGERIVAIQSGDSCDADISIEDLGDLVISPGMIDSHVHVNEPGRTEWEGFETATRAAAAGGVTTIVDMPLNSSPVTTTVEALRKKRDAAAGKCCVDVSFYGGLIPGNAQNIEGLLDEGVYGIKAFLCDSGLAEFPPVGEREIREVLPLLAARNVPLLVHAELPLATAFKVTDGTSYKQYVASRPRAWERAAIELLVRLCREFRAPIHVVHLADAESLELIRAAKQEGLPLTVETCPHYLHFTEESIPDGDTRFKCAPPIRSTRDRDALWHALCDGTIDTIGSDHSPCPPEMKLVETGDFTRAWGGISSLQLTLATIWTESRERGMGLNQLALWLSANPARLVRMGDRKGKIKAGFDADLVVWDPDKQWTVNAATLEHRQKLTPYDGAKLWGHTERTYVRGQLVYADGIFATQVTSHLNQRQSVSAKSAAGFLNGLTGDESRAALAKCCASRAWVAGMLAKRPFESDDELVSMATSVWWSLSPESWLEAFAAHPMIGDLEGLRAKYANTKDWTGSEQAGVKVADESTLRRLAEANEEYRDKFGYIFIVCASGKTAEEMLAMLEERLTNNPAIELPLAAAEQLKITQLRLQKLVP